MFKNAIEFYLIELDNVLSNGSVDKKYLQICTYLYEEIIKCSNFHSPGLFHVLKGIIEIKYIIKLEIYM